MNSTWGTWPQRVAMVVTVAALIWGAAVLAVNVRATAAIVSNLSQRVNTLDRWRDEVILRERLEVEIRERIRAEQGAVR